MNKEFKFPEMLKKLIKEKGIRREDFAYDIGVCKVTIDKWASYASVPGLYMVMQIADYFEVSLDYLIYGE